VPAGFERRFIMANEQRTLFPWMLVGAGALVYWTIALGIGIPSLAGLLEAPRAVHRSSSLDRLCVTSAAEDGRAVTFGTCFNNVRFVLDSPELARPPHTVPRFGRALSQTHPRPAIDPDTVYAGPDPEVDEGQPEPLDSIGRTAY
jgi:hypothetical protein